MLLNPPLKGRSSPLKSYIFIIYNILIMEEKQGILAAGAGASTKKMLADEKVKRCENVKDITSYISRVDEMIERKRQLFSEE